MKIIISALGFGIGDSLGGSARLSGSNAIELAKKGHEVVFLCTNRIDKKNKLFDSFQEKIIEGVRVMYLNTFTIPFWYGDLGPHYVVFPKKIKTINYKNISKSISKSLGRKYAFHSTLNAGAFAINDNVNIWKCFQKNIKLAAKKGRIFGTDQVALALSIYEDGLPSEFLPAYCNWMCEFNMPKFDSEKSQFVEPYIPNHPIALVHLAGLDNIRMDKNILSDVETLDGLRLSLIHI